MVEIQKEKNVPHGLQPDLHRREVCSCDRLAELLERSEQIALTSSSFQPGMGAQLVWSSFRSEWIEVPA